MKTILIAASTLDGFIARTIDQKSTKWTSKQDFTHFVKITKQAGVAIMGRKTYETIGKPLKDRLNIVMTSSPIKSNIDNLIFTKDNPEKILKDLETKGYQCATVCGGASIYSLFLNKNLIDEIYLTIEPIFFGTGISLFNQTTKTQLKLLKMEKANDQGTLFLDYQVLK